MDHSDKKIKKTLARGIKYLRQYRLKTLEFEEKNKAVYDGGATILLSYLQGKYAVDLGFKDNCGNLVKCSQKYMVSHPRNTFYANQEIDLFETNFLTDIYLQKYRQYKLEEYIKKMEHYLQTGGGFINQLMPVLDIFSQRQTRYLNVGLGLFGLIEKNSKAEDNKQFKHLKKRIARELADIFNNNSKYDELYLDAVKSYALLLLHLLNEEDRIDEESLKRYISCLLRTQNSLGHWINSDNYDAVNEVNNTLLTIFSVVNLLNYYNKYYSNQSDYENENDNNNDNNNNNDSKNTIEGFQGGFLTPRNLDAMKSSKICMTTIIEIIIMIFLIIIMGYLTVKYYRARNI